MKPACRIVGQPWGMGDTIWMLPILKALHREYESVYVETPWPQVYEGFSWIKVLDPSESDSPYATWTMFRESIASVEPDRWATSVPVDAEPIRVCETGDYATRLRSFYAFEGDGDLSFPLSTAWVVEAIGWFAQNVPRETGKPRILLHVPMYICGKSPRDPAFARYCDPSLFSDLFIRFGGAVSFFDAQRVKHFENYRAVCLPIPSYMSDGGGAPVMWALAAMADAIVTTDNHMLPIALAFQKPTLYLAGNVPLDYLFDPRIDAHNVERVPEGHHDAGEAFERVLGRVGP